MDPAASSLASIKAIQGAFSIITALQLTAYLWPQHAQVQDGSAYDYIIIGSGSAGSVVAARLSEDPNITVLVLEAGGDPPLEASMPIGVALDLQSRVDWNFTTETSKTYGQCHRNNYLHINSGKMIGGTGSLNYMLYARGIPNDYNTWAKIVNDDTWSWKNVLSFFKKLEKYNDPEYLASDHTHHGTDGTINIKQFRRNEERYLQAYQDIGYFIGNLNEERSVGYSPMMNLISDRERQSTAHAYLSPAKDRSNLFVLKHTLVTKILFDESKNADGVEALTADGKRVIYKAKKEVILSAGAFNTPKLLLLSGIGPKEHLESHNINLISDLPVGKNLQDHVSVSSMFNLEKLTSPPRPHSPYEFAAEAGYVGLAALDRDSKLPDYVSVTYVAPNNKIFLMFCTLYFEYSNKLCNQIYKSGENRLQSVNEIFNLKPKSKGQVMLRSTNPEDPPLIEANYLSEEEDLERLIDYVADFVQIVNSTYFRSIEAELNYMHDCKDFVKDSREFWRCYCTCLMSGVQNYIGTAQMGSVVDTRLKVLGVNRLRVADASVMPSLVSGGSYAPVIMIAEKLVDFIKNNE